MNGTKLYHFRPKGIRYLAKDILSSTVPSVAENCHLKGHTLKVHSLS